MKYLLAALVALLVAAGVFLATRPHGLQPVVPRPVPAPVQPAAPGPIPVPTPPPTPVADCVHPAPGPNPPDGATATADEMRHGHDVIQAYVETLEAYQTCRNGQVDHASVVVTDQQTQAWTEAGNEAVDEANAAAAAFAAQLKIFKARQSAPATPSP